MSKYLSKYKKLFKDTAVFAFGDFGSKIIIFFLVPLYTHVLTREEYGTADLVFTFSQLLMPVICLAIYNSILRFGINNKKPENVLYCGVIVWVIGCFISILVSPLLGLYKPISSWRWYLLLHVNSSIALTLFQNHLKVKGANFKYSIVSITQTTLLATLNILFLVVFKLGVKGYLLGNALASFFAALLSFIIGKAYKDLSNGHLDLDLLFQMVKFSSPLILNNVSWWIIQSSDRIMIEYFSGADELGLYTAAVRIPSLITVFVSIFQQAWGISSIVEMDSTNDNGYYSEVLELYLVVMFGACILINAIIKPFMGVYVGEAFYSAWRLAPLLVVSTASFSAVAAYYGSLYSALKKSVNNMITTIIGAVINLIMNYVLINWFNALGAVYGTLISYFVLAVARMIDVNRFVRIGIDYVKYGLNCLLVLTGAILITNDYNVLLVSSMSMVLFFLLNMKSLKRIVVEFIEILSRKREK